MLRSSARPARRYLVITIVLTDLPPGSNAGSRVDANAAGLLSGRFEFARLALLPCFSCCCLHRVQFPASLATGDALLAASALDVRSPPNTEGLYDFARSAELIMAWKLNTLIGVLAARAAPEQADAEYVQPTLPAPAVAFFIRQPAARCGGAMANCPRGTPAGTETASTSRTGDAGAAADRPVCSRRPCSLPGRGRPSF